MADVLFSNYVHNLTVDPAVGGSERIPVTESTSVIYYITPSLLKTYINTQNQAATTVVPTATDELQGASSAGVQETYTVSSISDYVINALEALTVSGTIVSGDHLIFSDNGTLSRVLVSDVVDMVVDDALDFSTSTALDTNPSDGDLFPFHDGAPKHITYTALRADLWDEFASYVAAETELTDTNVAGGHEMYILDAGTPKRVQVDSLKTYIGVNAGDVTASGSTSTGYIPKWTSTSKQLEDGYTVTTTVGDPGVDTALPTDQAVRAAIEAGPTISDLSGTITVADADLLLVDDGPGTNVKVTFTEVWTWIVGKFQGLGQEATPVDADILTIQDTTDSNALKETTLLEMKTYMGISDLPTTAGVGITGASDNFASSVEKVGTLFRTTIVIDIDGLNSGDLAGDIIGDDGTGVAHLGAVTTAVNGTIFAGKMECLELPVGGDTDIDLYSAVESTGVEDDPISGLTNTPLLNAGTWAANDLKSLTAFPTTGRYLYLVNQGTADATYTAGIFVITLWGK